VSGAEVNFETEEDEFYRTCPRCQSRQLIQIIHGMPAFRDEFQQSTYAARDRQGQWYYRTPEEFEAERRLARESGVDLASPRLNYTHYYGSADGPFFELAGCCIEYGDPSVYLNSTCRACGLVFGFSEDHRNDELAEGEEYDDDFFIEDEEDED